MISTKAEEKKKKSRGINNDLSCSIWSVREGGRGQALDESTEEKGGENV